MKKLTCSDIRVGISGWRYVPWRGSFYPNGLVQKNELHFASRTVNSIEINGSFYGLQTPERYLNWYADTPEDFIFSVKAPREITHIKRLRNVDTAVADFFASGPLHLGDKLGAILWQFPPTFKFEIELFKDFLTLLPKTLQEGKVCAKQSDKTFTKTPLKSLTDNSLKPLTDHKLRHAIEIRNASFVNENFIDLLKNHGIALVIADTAGRWPQLEEITSNFIYMRLHGDTELYRNGYSDSALNYWFERMSLWSQGSQPSDAKLVKSGQHLPAIPRDIYCYFDNTDKLWAPYDARKILEKFELTGNLEEAPGKLRKDFKANKKSTQDGSNYDLLPD